MKVFKEEQRFTQTWIIVLIIMSSLLPIIIILSDYLKNDSSIAPLNLYITIGVAVLVSSLIFLFKLDTRIDEKGIHYKFFPFHLKFNTIYWDDINKAYVRKYDAITEYGGWGLKGGLFWKKSNGVAFNVSGDIGIQLELVTGKKILLGTKQKEQALQVLHNYSHKFKS